MSDHSTNDHHTATAPPTLEELLRGLEPMGDLTEFAIDDLSAEDEDEFFGILERA
jgi:hypothetical protein